MPTDLSQAQVLIALVVAAHAGVLAVRLSVGEPSDRRQSLTEPKICNAVLNRHSNKKPKTKLLHKH